MNWTTIIKDCPKSFDLWFKHAGIAIHKEFILRTWTLPMEEYRSNEESVGYPLRGLYDFFDQQGLHIYIRTDAYLDGINWLWQILWYDRTKLLDGTMQYGDNGEYDNRTIAEQAAFERAFQLLEQKLTQRND